MPTAGIGNLTPENGAETAPDYCCRRTSRWESHIWDCGKQVYLGGFNTAHAAARAYDRAAIKFRGLDADINFSLTAYDEDMKQMKDLTKEEFVQKTGRWEAHMGQFLGNKPYELETVNSFGGSNSEMKMPVEVNNEEPMEAAPKPRGGAATAAKEKRSSLSKGFVLLFILFCLFATLTHTAEASACKRRRHPPAQKPKVILVHGFSSGGFSWFKTRYILEMAGYNVTSIDLKACGLDLTDISQVNTFEEYNEPLDRLMAQLPEREKVVVVGGSAGGVSVTKVLHDHPKKVLVAIYLSATMLKSGYLTCEDLEMGVPYFRGSGCHTSCPRLPEPTCFEKSALGWREIPLRDQTEDYTLGKSVARPGPLRAILTANFTEAAQKSSMIDRVPRVYIKSRLDQILLPAQQDAMIKMWPPCEVVEINTGHDSPFTRPQLVSELIVNATLYSPVI